MVIVRLIGGLGNQLFQYALGRHIAHRHGVSLKLDISAFESHELRSYNLSHFNIIEDFASADEIAALKWGEVLGNFPRIALWLQQLRPIDRRSYIIERHFHFDPDVLKSPADVYLEGYWQSEKYFKGIEDLLRSEFTVRTAPEAHDINVASRIMNEESVSVHVRRADYVTNNQTRTVHRTSSLEYYASAIRKINELSNTPHLFVFSDDPDWAMANLRFGERITFVTHNDTSKNYQDIRLMSLCRYHIIANSSFSWWSAWLCSYPGKIVCAPKQWFVTPDHDVRDLIPSDWHVI